MDSFLGLSGYYRRYIESYSAICEPLTRLANLVGRWGGEEQSAHDVVKAKLMSSPVMAHPNPEHTQIVTTDASRKGLGAILSQSPIGAGKDEQVVAYASKSLTGAQRGYEATELEAWAVVWALETFRHYLIGRKFILYTPTTLLWCTYLIVKDQHHCKGDGTFVCGNTNL